MYVDCCGMGIKCLKQALRFPVAIIPDHNIVSVSKVKYMDVWTDLNPWVALQGLTKNLLDYVGEDYCAHLCWTPERISKDIEALTLPWPSCWWTRSMLLLQFSSYPISSRYSKWNAESKSTKHKKWPAESSISRSLVAIAQLWACGVRHGRLHASTPVTLHLMWQGIALKSVNIARMAHVTPFIKRLTFKPRPNAVNYWIDKLEINGERGRIYQNCILKSSANVSEWGLIKQFVIHLRLHTYKYTWALILRTTNSNIWAQGSSHIAK